MKFVKIISFRQEAIGVDFVPLTKNKNYSHVVVITLGPLTIGTDYLEKGKEVNEKIAEEFYKKHVRQEEEQ